MSEALVKITPGQIIEQVIIKGNLANLTPEERTSYYAAVCESVGLNPLTKPFEYLTLSGKQVLYATRTATDQLRNIHRVSLEIADRTTINDVYIVRAKATLADGRVDESTGAVSITGLKGDALANALMKAETKAKRRVTLSICGLGTLDETEIETIPNAQRWNPDDEPEPPPKPTKPSPPKPELVPGPMAPITGVIEAEVIEPTTNHQPPITEPVEVAKRDEYIADIKRVVHQVKFAANVNQWRELERGLLGCTMQQATESMLTMARDAINEASKNPDILRWNSESWACSAEQQAYTMGLIISHAHLDGFDKTKAICGEPAMHNAFAKIKTMQQNLLSWVRPEEMAKQAA